MLTTYRGSRACVPTQTALLYQSHKDQSSISHIMLHIMLQHYHASPMPLVVPVVSTQRKGC
jgi:hypothetical protein